MNRRHFWLIPEFTKFRTVFENEETVLGIGEDREHRLFRKDTGRVCFDEREALQCSLAALAEKEVAELLEGRAEVVCV